MLEAKNIHKTYNNGDKAVEVLKGINLTIEKGRFIAVVGPSGAGKSTLLHILGGLDSPTQGEIIFQQEDLYALADADISRVRNEKIGFVFQFYHLLSEFTVLENVLMPALIKTAHKGTPRLRSPRCRALGDQTPRREAGQARAQEHKEEALRFLHQVGLTERITHFPSELSGGEKQRVAIVRGLINRPDLLLCDEPTGNLDSATGDQIISLIKKINLENRMSVVLVTHNIELAKVADQVYHLRDGILVN